MKIKVIVECGLPSCTAAEEVLVPLYKTEKGRWVVCDSDVPLPPGWRFARHCGSCCPNHAPAEYL